MPQVLFDTHAAARKLEKAGHKAQQAEAVVEVVSEATEFGARMQHDLERIKYVVENHMATKEDLAELRTSTKDDIGKLRTEIAKIPEVVREVLRQETPMIQLRSVLAAGSMTGSLGGLAVMVLADESLRAIAIENGALIGLMMILASSVVMISLSWPRRSS